MSYWGFLCAFLGGYSKKECNLQSTLSISCWTRFAKLQTPHVCYHAFCYNCLAIESKLVRRAWMKNQEAAQFYRFKTMEVCTAPVSHDILVLLILIFNKHDICKHQADNKWKSQTESVREEWKTKWTHTVSIIPATLFHLKSNQPCWKGRLGLKRKSFVGARRNANIGGIHMARCTTTSFNKHHRQWDISTCPTLSPMIDYWYDRTSFPWLGKT